MEDKKVPPPIHRFDPIPFNAALGAAIVTGKAPVTLMVAGIELVSPDLSEVIRTAVSHWVRSESFVMMPVRAQLTTNEAADYLGMSRVHLVKLLDRGDIPFFLVGKHRRLYLSDVLSYEKKVQPKQLQDAWEAFLVQVAKSQQLGSTEI